MNRAPERSMHPPPIGAESFEQFYRMHRRRLVGLAYSISGSQLAADDLVQDVMESVYRDWERIKARNDPLSWVRRMVANRSVSAYRRRLAEAKAIVRLGVGGQTVRFPEPTADVDRVWTEVRRLPRRQAQTIALTYVEQLTLDETARVLGCSKATVNTHLRRARETLSHRLRTEK